MTLWRNESLRIYPVQLLLWTRSDTKQLALIWTLCTASLVLALAVATVMFFRFRRRSRKPMEEERRLNRVSQDPISADTFAKEHRRRCRTKELQYEFKAIEQISVGDKHSASIRNEGQHKVSEAARLLCNREKNLTDKVLPYERNIVRLDADCEGSSDGQCYINASWIDGYNQPKKFIAAQGPLASTKLDFWYMIWQYQCDCVVMTTNLFEHARQQCDKYWHNVHACFGDIDVWVDDLYSTAEYETRLFKVKRGDEMRLVRQFQFKNWSHFDTPLPTTVIEIRRKVNDWMRGKTAPIVVHCSDGAGRTGTYICIDIEISKVEDGRSIDILQQTLALRKARPGLVGNLSQYKFVYETLATYVACRPTTIKVFEFAQATGRMSRRDPATGKTGFEAEFACLNALVKPLSVGECAGGHRAENRWKSRDVMVQPPERARPYLLTQDSASGTDFINAVYVDGHIRTNQYIVTQWPLKNTICDFWKLIHDHHVTVVIILSDMTGSLPRFWPAEIGSEFGYGSVFVILQEEFRVSANVMCKMHAMTKIGSSPSSLSQEGVRHVAFLYLTSGWPTGRIGDKTGHGLLELACLAEATKQNLEEFSTSPLLVISSDGITRCGVFCVLHMTMDKMRFEGEIDILRSVDKVKRNRPELVTGLSEYEHCFSLALILVEYFFSGRVSILDNQCLLLKDLETAPPVQGRPTSTTDFRFPTARNGGHGRRALDRLICRRKQKLKIPAAAAGIV